MSTSYAVDAQGQLARLQQTLVLVLARTRQGALLREGIKVVIAGSRTPERVRC